MIPEQASRDNILNVKQKELATKKTVTNIAASTLAISAILISVVTAQCEENSATIDRDTVTRWSKPYRDRHHLPDYVIPAKPNIKGFDTVHMTNVPTLEDSFKIPPDSARPGVYWYFMDGNLDCDEMVADLESMKDAGIGNLVFLEVNVGVPRGSVDFMSEQWQGLYVNAVRHAERLGIDITLGAGPGWTGSGGPWVEPEQSMQHLVFSEVNVKGPATFDSVLPVPEQRSTTWHTMRSPFYEDVVVYAFPRCIPVIGDINEKALYERNPYTSMPGVKPYLPAPATYAGSDESNVIDLSEMIDLTDRLQKGGRLKWTVPTGEWTILRMGRRSTGASTRPAPAPGVGFDHDKLNPVALDEHFKHYYGKLINKVGPRAKQHGWTTVHLDSWEMGAQNWAPKLREEFKKRCGYDPLPYFVTFSGRAVRSVELSERFLWDVRLTAQELVLENYAGHLKELGHRHGFELSIEPYDMNPTADLDLGAVADVPMGEFWGAGFGFDSSFSCIEATSIAHTMGRSIVSAETFTGQDQWQQYPWSMKNQGDWAFCMGINRFVFHTFAHKPLGDEYRPGMTMGPYGVHWDRGQTWWPMVKDYHRYITRCSHLLRQGVTISDILYLTPEGAPHVFRAPASALQRKGPLADKKGYGFDGCSPNILIERAQVKDGCVVFPGGTSYRLLVLPRFDTMTPRLLEKITQLVKAGAVVYGAPPSASPSLSGYPQCDAKVKALARTLWGTPPSAERQFGKGRTIRDPGVHLSKETEKNDKPLLPDVGSWIWLNQGNPAHAAPVGDVHFRYTWDVSDLKSLAEARIETTTDNSFILTVNGKQVLLGDNFNIIYSADILPALRKGKNTITVLAHNASDAPNPAGFIAAIRLRQSDGSKKVIVSDQTWHASGNGTGWSAAKLLGPGNMAPWNLRKMGGTSTAELYPDYATTTALLKDMHVAQDFQSDGPVRYGHRRTSSADIYFVSNTTSQEAETTCIFRVQQGAPQLWDPVTAEIRALPQFTRQEKTTSVPMTFEPYQSFFVIFPLKGSSKPAANVGSANFPKVTPVTILEGSWEVCFDPKWGGPEKVTFGALQDWTDHVERSIKYYSGIATYRKTFDSPQVSGGRLYLDLGTVHDMAQVKLNGRDLGVVWCAPLRVDVTDAVKTEGNALEIEIANRWPNRMLGDQQAPDKDVRTVKWESGFLGGKEFKTGRYTFATTGGPNRLLPSGLLGPVTLLVDSAIRGTAPEPPKYRDGRPETTLRMNAKDHGIVLRYADGPDDCDILGARDAWVFEDNGTYYMHYDAAGPKGWLCSLAVSNDLLAWEKKGPVLDFGKPGEDDAKSASYGITYCDGKEWHMFYLGTPNVSGPPNLVPSFPYLTMKAKGRSPAGPWIKQKDVTPFRTKPQTYYSITASPGQVIKNGDEYLQFFSATTRKPGNPCVQRTLGIARTEDLDGPWTVDPQPMVPIEEQIENSTLHYEKAIKTWFLFTNHIGIMRGEYTDAIWVYWSKDLNKWDPANKAVVLDGQNCTWSRKCIGLPSVVPIGERLALFYDAPEGDSTSHMRRHIGLAWLDLPLSVPRNSE